jgi:hypothetical protein
VLLLAGSVVFALVWYLLVFAAAITCSGDGGVPFAAEDSLVGRLCDSRDGAVGAILGLLVFASPLLLLGLGAAALVRRSAGLLGAAFSTALAALGLGALPFLALPASCAPADQAAYEAWVEDRSGNRSPEPPADCQKY